MVETKVGIFADQECNGNPECNGHGKCNINTGHCICDSGYTGKDCSQLSVVKSSFSQVCDTVSGTCICAAEYFGPNCSQSKCCENLDATFNKERE